MTTALSPGTLRERADRYSDAQRRTIAAALELFADRGFGGTSLQMIADAVGVTKAAIYHQFRTREAIAIAVIEVELARLEGALEDAEAAPGKRSRELLLARIIEVAVERRRAHSTLQSDPELVRFWSDDALARRFWSRLFSVLLGDTDDRVRAAVLSATIGAAAHPFVRDLDDETLRRHLFDQARRLL